MSGKLMIAEDSELGKVVVLSFPYNPMYIEKIKSDLHPKKFIRENKCWITPVENLAVTLAMFPHFEQSEGFKKEFEEQKKEVFTNRDLKEESYAVTIKNFELLPHQKTGINYLVNKGCTALLDDMGLGKTLQLIGTFKVNKQLGKVEKCLVLCPPSLLYNWKAELDKTEEFTCAVIEGTKKEKIELLKSENVDFYIINYEGIRNNTRNEYNADGKKIGKKKADHDIEDFLVNEFSTTYKMMLVLDESHSVKNYTTGAFKLLKKMHKNFPCRYISSGTLVANKPEDVWAQMYIVDPQILGKAFYEDFAKKYCLLGNAYSKYAISGYKNLNQLKFVLSQNSIRRLKEDLPNLPEKVFKNYYIDMCKKQEFLYKKLDEEVLSILTTDDTVETIKNNVIKLMQMACNPMVIDASLISETNKVKELDRLLAERIVDGGEKIVVWSYSVENLKFLYARYAGYNPVLVYGGIKDKKVRFDLIQKFQNDDTCKLFIGNPQACSMGITLTKSATAIFYDRDFNPVNWKQAVDRVHRISQTKTVEIICLINRKTIDEDIDSILTSKGVISEFLVTDKVRDVNVINELCMKDIRKKLLSKHTRLV